MSESTVKHETHEYPKVTYLNHDYSLKSWLLTVDHKRIAILYLISTISFFFIGAIAAFMMRLELMTPAGDLVDGESYNKLFTVHGIMMVFFFLIPSVPAILGNFLLPIMIGAKDLALPKINLGSWYVYSLGGALALGAIILGGVDTGWTFYTPYSTTYSNSWVLLAGLGIFINGFSSIMTGLNFIATVHKMRAPGLTWFRLPLFVWAHYATSVIMVLGTPVVAITVLLVAVERTFGIGIFDPSIGGDPILFQHMFWFYSHPAVYIMVLPAMGAVSEVIAAFSKSRPFGYPVIAFSSMGIAILGFIVWGHHMFVTSQSIYAGLLFSILSFMVAVPSAIKTFNWTATMYKGQVSLQAPMLYMIGFLGLFVIGGTTGVMLASMGIDVHLHDTYFVIAHFHYVMVGGTIMAFLGGLHFWWPKITGRMFPNGWATGSALLVFVGFNLTFFPQFVMGYLGMPRRYWEYVPEFQIYHILSTAGATVLGLGYVLPTIYLTWSLKWGRVAGPNPWGAKGLEWTIQSPPLPHNFIETPVVTEEAYAYEEHDAESHGSGYAEATGAPLR